MDASLDPDALLDRLDQLIDRAGALSPPEPAARKPREGAVRILIADDNEDYRSALRHLFAGGGYEVFEAADGRQALSLAGQVQPDLFLLDFDMPQANGYEVLQELRRREETRKLPVVLITGAPNRKRLRELDLDVSAFLDKPVANGELLKVVARVLDLPPVPEPPPEESAPPAEEIAPESGLLLEEQKPEPEEDAQGLDVVAMGSPVVNRVNRILVQAVDLGASDIHIEPQERQAVVRVRVDGSLRPLSRVPAGLMPQLSARIKIMSNLVITERRRPQDGQIRASIKGRKIEFRVSILPSLHGEKIVLRVLGGASLKPSAQALGLRPRDLEAVRRAQQSPHGLILVTGPTGSGKTTTLYTLLQELNAPDVNIMTAEDPVEYELAGITQIPVRPNLGMTFEAILRAFLRQDPDIMLVGEIRDGETAEIAVKAAITGHLVLSTLHTNSAPGAVMRLGHMGVASHLLTDSLKLVVAQRLVRRLCPECRGPAEVPEDVLGLVGDARERLAKAQAGRGCPACGKTGYKGRMPLFEVMELRSPEVRRMVLAGSPADELARRAAEEGMQSLKDAAIDAVNEGKTSVEEALNIMLSE